MKTQYYTASSLDGFLATEDDSIAWLDALADITLTSYPAFIADVGALAMGSATYEWMRRHVLPTRGFGRPTRPRPHSTRWLSLHPLPYKRCNCAL